MLIHPAKSVDIMEEKMRKNVTTGLIGLSLILCLMGLFGSSWLTLDDGSEMEMEGSMSLSEYHIGGGGIEMSMEFSEMCDMADGDDEEFCKLATAGTTAKVFLWFGFLLTLLMVVMAILPMAGVSWMDENVPDIAKSIISWSAGSVILCGVLLWYILLPSTGGLDLGMSAYITIIAGLLGLGSTVLEKYEINVTMARR